MPAKRRRIDVRGSLKASWKDGFFAAIMSGVTDHYVIPFALLLGATSLQIGWVSALPNLFSSVLQLFAVRFIEAFGGRLKLLLRAVLLQATLLLLMSALPVLEPARRVELFLFLLVTSTVCGGVAGPAWGSLISDYIPFRKRGRYFGWRNQTLGLVNLGSIVASGLLLYLLEGSRGLGFSCLFVAASLSRFLSAFYLARMHEPRLKKRPADDFDFLMFVGRFRESNFVKFVAFVAGLTFASHLASPFFAVFMLRDLEFSYLTYMLLQVAAALAGLVALPLWGRHADVVGNVRVLRLAALLASLIPLFWLVSHHPSYLALVQMLAGFAWSGVTLSASNFIYDAVSPPKRARCIGYFNVINGVALFLGAGAGGWLATRLPELFRHRLLSLFLLSALLRIAFYLLLFRRFREVRPSREVSLYHLFFSVVGIRPLLGAWRE